MSLRSGLSATLFLSGPSEYDGGELLVEDTNGVHAVKLEAGPRQLRGRAPDRGLPQPSSTLGDPVRRLRTFLFYCHLTAGCLAGLVILVMSATGATLAMKPQILNVIERNVRFVTPQRTPR